MIKHQLLVHVGLALAVAICTALPATIVVVLQSLWTSMTADLGQEIALRLVLGAMPTSMYLLAPVACIIVTVWMFRANSENTAIPAMFATGMSVTTCATPALLLGLLLALASAFTAWVVAPHGIVMVEDAKYELNRNIDVSSLREGQFHTFEFDDSFATLRFTRSLGGNRFEGIFVSSTSKQKGSFSIISKTAVIQKDRDNLTFHFEEGNMHTTDGEKGPVFVKFTSYAHVFPIKGSSHRKNITILELSYQELASLARSETASRMSVGLARSELAKRFLVPAMNLTHATLAVGLLFSIGPIRIRLENVHLWIAIGLVTAHVAIVFMIEILARASFLVLWTLAAALVIEFVVGTALLLRAGRTLRKLSWLGLLHRVGATSPRRRRMV